MGLLPTKTTRMHMGTLLLYLAAVLWAPGLVGASLFMTEDKTCDPLATNWLAYTGFRIQRLYGYSIYPGVPETRHVMLLSHCSQGRVNYGPAVVPVGRHEDVAWGVNICGSTPDPSALAPAPVTFVDRNLKKKLLRLKRRRQRWTLKNPLYRTKYGTKVWVKWIASPRRKWLFQQVRKMNVGLLARQHEEMNAIYHNGDTKKTWSYMYENPEDDELLALARSGMAIDQLRMMRVGPLARFYDWKRRMLLAASLRVEAVLNSTIPLADAHRLMNGYGALDSTGSGGSERSKFWRKMGGRAAAAQGAGEVGEAAGRFPGRGSSAVSHALSRLSSNPLDPFTDPPPYCYRLVRRKRYALRHVSVYMQNTVVGGLFMCPRYGRCTNQNAVPVLPVYSDNYEGQWIEAGPAQWYKAGAQSAERARAAFARAAGVDFSMGWVWRLIFAEGRGGEGQEEAAAGEAAAGEAAAGEAQTVGKLVAPVKRKVQAAVGLLANRLPTWLSLRRSVVQRVPFLYTLGADGRRGHESDGVAGTWPLWAHELDVDEAYEYDTLETRVMDRAVTKAVNVMASSVRHVDFSWDSMFKEEDGGKTVKSWPFTSFFSNNMLYRFRSLGFSKKRVWETVRKLQEPFE